MAGFTAEGRVLLFSLGLFLVWNRNADRLNLAAELRYLTAIALLPPTGH